MGWGGGGVDTDALPSSSPSLIWLSWGFGLAWAVTICGNMRRFRAKGHKIKVVVNAILKTFCVAKLSPSPTEALAEG